MDWGGIVVKDFLKALWAFFINGIILSFQLLFFLALLVIIGIVKIIHFIASFIVGRK